ncbi:SDR family NAD(P)-dependent oxidoreductase [Cytophagaceae bacterium DM2B3-1]|uniref:SDR family NAD(P)-dependent oxidoreductase n=1 Tax=Xanthocytophaga flava TaxID=3048013 RepID=A0ABT7CRQ4_9BACT|nr:SDR family NAD(P)-dependent oxidoreductase [Xanthocytophaga flavus]MDJ1496191.1 SDR family NAD(P)-dependent oxidoreductase [Xanthocytophaga flavus]
MDLAQSHILITGGSEGIGYGLASLFMKAGSSVLITGRNPEKLQQAATTLPGLKTFAGDIGDAKQREMLAIFIQETMQDLNIVINNAGIQRRISLAADNASWSERQNEIDILLSGPIHLNHLLIPVLLAHRKPSFIINVTSGGAYIPQVFAPVYSACKAALHSYTMTLRHSLANTSCKVIELIPPAVQTGLAGLDAPHGVDLNDFCKAVFLKLTEGDTTEIGYGPTADLVSELSGKPVVDLFEANSSRFPVSTYAI